MSGFINFIREQGVVGLAIGFILGGAVSKVVASLVSDIINPLVGVLLGKGSALRDSKAHIGSVEILWGSFITTVIDFLVIALVVYIFIKILGLNRLDESKNS